MPFIDAKLPDWFLRLAEALAGKRLNSLGVIEEVPPAAFFEAAGEAKSQADSADAELARIAAWLARGPTDRSVSPYSESNVETYLGQLLNRGTSDDHAGAARLTTSAHPRVLARIGRHYCLEGEWERGEYYLSRATAIAPEDPEIERIFEQVVQIFDPDRNRYPRNEK